MSTANKITKDNHLPKKKNGRYEVHSEQFNKLVDVVNNNELVDPLLIDNINELTTDNGILIDTFVRIKDGIVLTNTIKEFASGVGVTIELIQFKDRIISGARIGQIDATVEATAGTLTLSELHSGYTINMNVSSGGLIIKLPEWSLGTHYNIRSTVDISSGTTTIVPFNPDPEFLTGGVLCIDSDLANSSRVFKDIDEVFTMDGNDRGGNSGTVIHIEAMINNQWILTGTNVCNTAPATPWG